MPVQQVSSFSEASLTSAGEKFEWTGGINLITDNFTQDRNQVSSGFDYEHVTFGAFIQNIWNVSEKLEIESGLRTDYHDDYGFFTLPRLSVLMKLNNRLSIRTGGGMGYKIPTVFTEDAERIHYENIRPFIFSEWEPEQSAGGNLDINYNTPLSESVLFSINTLFFYTRINDPMVLITLPGEYAYDQPQGFIDTKGIETNVKLTIGDLRIFTGYTIADVKQHFGNEVSSYPLVAKHRLNNILMYEIEESLRIGLEAYYFSPQRLNDGLTGKQYWIFGLMAEKMWEKFSVFINLENITDTRQTRFDTIFTGPVSDPVFRDIYAPVDGFVINGGIKIRVF